jgi:hypothetical protein
MGKFTLGLGTAWRRGRAMARRRSNILAASLGLLAQWLPSPIAGPPSLYTGGEGAIFFYFIFLHRRLKIEKLSCFLFDLKYIDIAQKTIRKYGCRKSATNRFTEISRFL